MPIVNFKTRDGYRIEGSYSDDSSWVRVLDVNDKCLTKVPYADYLVVMGTTEDNVINHGLDIIDAHRAGGQSAVYTYIYTGKYGIKDTVNEFFHSSIIRLRQGCEYKDPYKLDEMRDAIIDRQLKEKELREFLSSDK